MDHPCSIDTRGAILIGQRIKISKNNHFFFELTAGIGLKYRSVNWEDAPSEYVHTQVYERIDNFPLTSGTHTAGLLL